MEQLLPEKLTLLHFILAYTGMFLYILLKVKKATTYPNFQFKAWLTKPTNIISIIASIVMVPVILIMACDPAIADTLPINNVTSVLAGWQTNSTFRSLMGFYGKKGKDKEDDGSDMEAETNNNDTPTNLSPA